MSNERERVALYDCVRIIATLLVVLGHASYLVISTDMGGIAYDIPLTVNGHYQDDVIPKLIRWIGAFAYSFHMPLFFILSGAVYRLKSDQSFDNLVKKKAYVLLVPYLVWGLFYMLPLKEWSGFYDNANIGRVYRDFLEGGSESGHLWFLITLFWCFILCYALVHFLGEKKLIIALLIALIVSKMQLGWIPAYLGFRNSLSYLFWFILGYIFEKELRLLIEKIKMRDHLIIFIVMTTMMIFAAKMVMAGATVDIAFRCAWFFELSYLLSVFVMKHGWLKKAIAAISPVCIYIYIFHDPLEYVILKVAYMYDWLSNGIYVYVYFALRTLGVIVISAIMGYIVIAAKKRIKRYCNVAQGL